MEGAVLFPRTSGHILWGPRRWTAFCTTVLVLGFWLSLGPGDGGPSLHGLLVSVVPGYAQLRSPFRFAVFVELVVALLAAGGLAFFHARTRTPPARLGASATKCWRPVPNPFAC